MPELNEPAVGLSTDSPRHRWPKKMLCLTGIVVMLIVLAHVFISDLDDAVGLGLDGVMILTMASIAILNLLWMAWFLFFSRMRWWNRLLGIVCVAAFPVVLFSLFRPVNGGDANIMRFEPVWMARAEAGVVEVVESVDGVDLTTETDNDYPRFLGPRQNATIIGLNIDPDTFGTASEPIWKQPIGKGWSGFAARNGFAVTMEQRLENECVTCYDIETGTVRWVYKHPERHRDTMNLGRVGPRATPTIHDGDVYAVGGVGNFVCLNGSDGTVKWQKSVSEIVGSKLTKGTDSDGTYHCEIEAGLAWGRSGSPLVVDDLVIVPGGGSKGQKTTLLAFDRQTGELRWRGGNEMIGYGSPILATVAGTRQILYIAESKVMGFDPQTGDVLWDHPRLGESTSAANCSQPTVISTNRIVTSKGYPDGGGEVIELTTNGDEIKAKSIWSDHRVLKTKLTSPVIHGGHAYSISNGFLECADLADGKRVWKRRGRFGHGQILLVDDMLLVHSESGTLYLVAADSAGYRELASFKTIDGVCWNTMCLYGSRLLLRSELEAASYELPVLEQPLGSKS